MLWENMLYLAANVTSFFQSLKDIHSNFPRMAARLDIEDFFEEIGGDLLKYASNTFELSRTKVCVTAANSNFKLPVSCPCPDKNDSKTERIAKE